MTDVEKLAMVLGVLEGNYKSCVFRHKQIKTVTHWMPLPEPPKDKT